MLSSINRTFRKEMANFFALRPNNVASRAVIPPEARFEWGVAMFGVGIALYFALPFEPGLVLAAALLFTAAIAYALLRSLSVRWLLLIVALILSGVFRATWHTDAVDAPTLPKYERAYIVSGWVTAVEKSGSRLRWQIKVSEIEGLEPDKTPKYIRTTVNPGTFKAGDGVRIRSILSAPPGPVVPGGYNPARQAYFRELGGYGFSIGKPESYDLGQLSVSDRIKRKIVKFRFGIADRIMAAAPQETAGLQVALLTGIRTYIAPEQTDALRAAGLAHVLAISGLHMGLIAGSIFYVMTFLLACITPLSRRIDVRKPAAVFGALAATAYLVLSGASVATQRAYIMALIVFLAVILDRRAFSMRSVALAAVITLLWHPEALVSAGFQMSFSAVAALVVVYRYWDARRPLGAYQNGLIYKFKNGITTLSITSTVAGIATSGFAVLHFNRMANYGLIGNLLAMPIFTFWIMPSAILVFLGLPLGLEAYPLAIMGKGIEILLWVSNWVAGLGGAVVHIHATPNWVIGVYAFGFMGLCLGPKYIRYAGCVIIAACVLAWSLTPKPDIRISDRGAVAIWSEAQDNTLIVGRKNTDRYGREQFIRRSGQTDSQFKTYKSLDSLCDAKACRITSRGKQISLTAHPSEIIKECTDSDIIILTRRAAGPIAKRTCVGLLIDAETLSVSGAQNIYISNDKIAHEGAITSDIKARPWGRRL